MAYQYDEMGNVIGEYESEEERRRRLALEQPVKQTITYNADGTQEMTIKGTPEALSPANPNTPTVAGPVSPDQVYGSMLQAESGNRDFDAQGRPVTSPKGAMFASQVMPATARQPGYGIRPAQAQTPEEYNRVGQEYFQAMRKQFPGNEQAAIAAYNAGPGRVQQNMRANQGQMNVAQLPRETQGYLQKVGNMVSNMIPSAQAGTLPPQARPSMAQQAQASQQPQPDSVINDQVAAYEARQPGGQYSLATGQSGIGLQAPQAAAAQPAVDTRLFDFYQRNQDNPQALISMGYSDAPGMPDFLKDRMKNRAAELIQQQREEAAAKQQIPNMTESDIARALREKTTGGSYIKAALFGLLGMEQSAMAEAAKLGIGKETLTQINGQPALVKLAANGTPIEGYNAATGQKLKPEELVVAAGYGTTQKGIEVEAGTYLDPSGMVKGNWMLERKPGGGSQFRQVGTGKIATEEQANSLRKTGVQGTLADQRAKLIQELNLKLQGKTEEEKMAILRPYNQQLVGAGYAAVQPSEVGMAAPQIAGGAPQAAPAISQAQAAQAAQATPSATGPVAPTTVPQAAPAVGPRPTANQLEAQKAGQKEIVTEAAKQVAASADTQNMLNSIEKITGLLDSGSHNVGSVLSGAVGRGPIAQAIGAQFETVDAKNTKTILDTVNKLAADGLKALGSNPSTVDLEFWTKYKPDGSSDPDFVKEWIQSRSADLKRRLGFAASQTASGGTSGAAPAVPSSSQFKIISVEPGKK
jgi:soluble lytic murein transglycosylase